MKHFKFLHTCCAFAESCKSVVGWSRSSLSDGTWMDRKAARLRTTTLNLKHCIHKQLGYEHFLLFMDYKCFDLLIMCKPAHLLETGDLFPRPIAPSRPEFSLSSPSWSSLVWNLIRPKTTPDTSVKPACGCSCSAERFRDLCHHRNSLASSAGPLETNETCSYLYSSQRTNATCYTRASERDKPGKDLIGPSVN